MNTFLLRASTAIVFSIVVIGGILIHPITFLGLITLILVGSIREFYNIIDPMFKKDKGRNKFYRNMVLIMSLYACFIAYLTTTNILHKNWLFSIPLIFAGIFYTELVLRSKKPFRNIGINLLALYYISMPLSMTYFIAFEENRFTGAILLGILFIIWANDSGAYIIGSLIGKNKLIPHVSPNKTIEGFIGGGLFCYLVAYLNINFLHTIPSLEAFNTIKPIVWYIIAGIVFVFATMGDLVESLLKRSLDIKDSGNILPGHGGFLDRFDAFLFVLPFVVAVIKIFN